MKMMKAACLAAAVTILVLGLAACGSSTTDNPVTSTAPTTASTLPPDTAPAADVVVFNDPVLETGIRAALNKPEGDVTLSEAAALTELHLDVPWKSPANIQIKDISALKYFVNLKQIEMQFHAITDVSPLAGLVHLEGLMLGGNNITDITPLAGLAEMTALSIFNCQATDYSPLKNFTHLRVLYADHSTMSDLSVLAGLSGLETLGLKATKVTDVTPLAGLTKLTRLVLSENAITDFSPLKDIYPNLAEKDFELN